MTRHHLKALYSHLLPAPFHSSLDKLFKINWRINKTSISTSNIIEISLNYQAMMSQSEHEMSSFGSSTKPPPSSSSKSSSSSRPKTSHLSSSHTQYSSHSYSNASSKLASHSQNPPGSNPKPNTSIEREETGQGAGEESHKNCWTPFNIFLLLLAMAAVLATILVPVLGLRKRN